MWQPTLSSLRDVEQDEAGRLRAFREKFGRGWDVESKDEEGDETQDVGGASPEQKEESLMDLISGYGLGPGAQGERREKVKSGKGKGGQK